MLLQLALAGALALSMLFAASDGATTWDLNQQSGQTGYEGQPGNQSNGGGGNGQNGYEGQPGNQGGGGGNGQKGYEGQPGHQGGGN